MAPEDLAAAWTSYKPEWLFRVIVDCRIELSNNVIENTRRNGEDCSTVAAVSGMAYPVG
jgi:hypothetical protein